MPDVSKLLSALKLARPLDLVLIALVVMPWVLIQWQAFLSTLDLPEGWNWVGVAVVALAYIGVIGGLVVQSRIQFATEVAAARIEAYLADRGFVRMSDQRIAAAIDPDIDAATIQRIIRTYPDRFSRVKSVKYKGEDRGPGIKLRREPSLEDSEA